MSTLESRQALWHVLDKAKESSKTLKELRENDKELDPVSSGLHLPLLNAHSRRDFDSEGKSINTQERRRIRQKQEQLLGGARIGDLEILNLDTSRDRNYNIHAYCGCGTPITVTRAFLSNSLANLPSKAFYYAPMDRIQTEKAHRMMKELYGVDLLWPSRYVCPHISAKLRGASPYLTKKWEYMLKRVGGLIADHKTVNFELEWMRKDFGLMNFITDVGTPPLMKEGEQMGREWVLHKRPSKGNWTEKEFFWVSADRAQDKERYTLYSARVQHPVYYARFVSLKARARSTGTNFEWNNFEEFCDDIPPPADLEENPKKWVLKWQNVYPGEESSGFTRGKHQWIEKLPYKYVNRSQNASLLARSENAGLLTTEEGISLEEHDRIVRDVIDGLLMLELEEPSFGADVRTSLYLSD